MADYEGMRWLMCDFQVQTPEDGHHWADDETKLPDPRRPLRAPEPDENGVIGPSRPDERLIQNVAQQYLRRCHEVGLELIGVTDHNFSQKKEPRDWFVTHLVEQNKLVAAEMGRKPLYILPGFEVDIGYHVLCLFEPATRSSDIAQVNDTLCKLGLNENERFFQGRVAPLRRNGSNVSLKELIEIVQEQCNGIVIAAHSDQNDGVLNDARNIEDYKIEKLLAIEVTQDPPSRRVHSIIGGHDKAWSRAEKHPACVMSSDAKSLQQDENGQPVANSLGYRHTWLKMSKPSIEALRQAFLDPLSRVRVLGPRPSDAVRHPRITKVEVSGASFVDDQVVHFSEALTCVIGGRGSGKSSLLEYLRFALSPEEIVSPRDDEESALLRKRKMLKDSLREGAQVRVTFEVGNGVSDTLVYEPGRPLGQQRWLDGRDVADLKAVLRPLQVQFFSQGELSRMTSGARAQAQVLSLIDAAVGAPLSQSLAREQDIRARLKGLFQSSRDEARLKAEVLEATQEATEIERQLQARDAVKQESERNQLALEAKRHLQRMQKITASLGESVQTSIFPGIEPSSPLLPPGAANWPNAAWFAATSAAVEAARKRLLKSVGAALDEYRSAVTACLGDLAIEPTTQAIEQAHAQFRAACADRGINEDDIARMEGLEEKRQGRLQFVEQRGEAMRSAQSEAAKLPAVLRELHDVWRSQFELRSATAAAIQASVVSQTVRIDTSYMTDEESFKAAWERVAPGDKRGKLARRWEELGEAALAVWKGRGDSSVWETIEAFRNEPELIQVQGFDDVHQALFAHLDDKDIKLVWEDVRTTRVSDGIEVQLLRNDRTVAGSMSGTLSEGQRNTVLLNLMLAQGEGPIVIDQPEDELDSSFIFRTLVNDLRGMKTKRQLIVATHNANLPVNADAEQIYALEARKGRGRVLSQGGLDRSDVAQAVLNIMEGSEEAFKRRSEKYHF